MISVMTLLVLVVSYLMTDRNIRMCADFRNQILRTYIVYFIVLIFMEFPNIPVNYLRYRIVNPHGNNEEEKKNYSKKDLYV